MITPMRLAPAPGTRERSVTETYERQIVSMENESNF